MARDGLGFLVAAPRAGWDAHAPARSPHEQDAQDAATLAAWSKLGAGVASPMPLSACAPTKEAGTAAMPALYAAAALYQSLSAARLKALVRVGVPPSERPALWLALSGGLELRAAHDDGHYERLAAGGAGLPSLVHSLVEADARAVGVAWRPHPLTAGPVGAAAISRVLTALLNHNPRLGYARHLCHMAAFVLIVMGGPDAQEPTFWALAALLNDRLFGYCQGQWLLGVRVEQEVVSRLAARKLPRLTSHLATMCLSPASFTQAWLAGLFVGQLPPEVLARLWDCLIVEGPKMLGRACLALLKMYEQTLMSCTMPDVLRKVLDLRVSRTTDPAGLLSVAFKGIGSMPGELVDSVRKDAMRDLMAGMGGDSGGVAAGATPRLSTPATAGLALESGGRRSQRFATDGADAVHDLAGTRTLSGRLTSDHMARASSGGSGASGGSGGSSPDRPSRAGKLSSFIARLGLGVSSGSVTALARHGLPPSGSTMRRSGTTDSVRALAAC